MSAFQTIKTGFRRVVGLEAKSLASPDSALFELFGAAPSVSGIAITPRVAMSCAPVACAVRAISESVAQLPLHVFERTSESAKRRAPDHPAYELIHTNANEFTPSFEFRRSLTQDALLHRGGFAFINRVDGKPYELIRLRPETVIVRADLFTGEPNYIVTEGTAGERHIVRQDIIHLRSPISIGFFTESLITLAADTIGLALLLERHATRLMANGAKPSGLISLKGVTTPDALAKAKAAWVATHGGGNSGGTAVLPADASWQSLTLNSVDAEFMAMRKFAVTEIARVFRVPPQMLFDLERVTHSNGEQQAQEFLSYCLMGWVRAWEGELNLKLFAPDERKVFFAEFDLDGFARADLAARTEAQVKMIAARIINPNQARAQLNLEPYYPGGDSYENPNTTTAVLK